MSQSRLAPIGSVITGLLLVCLGTAAAQQAPLRKTDLVRLLTNPSMTRAQVADRVKAACLAFEPTGRDRVDLATLGADQTVMAAINDCVRRKAAAAAAAPPAGRPAAGPTRVANLLLLALQQRVFAPAGTDAAFQIQVTRAGRPAPGVPLSIQGQDLRAVTDARGVATFRFPAGTAVGVRVLSVVSAGSERAVGPAEVRLGVVPGPPSAVDLQPRRVEARVGEAIHRDRVTVSLRDAFGNPITGERVEFRPLSPALGIATFAGRTDSLGRVAISFVNATFKQNGDIGVFVGGKQVASLPVEVEPLVLSRTRTGFISGQDQAAVAGRPLRQPLVIEVRDTTGAAVAGKTVVLEVVNGAAADAVAETDAKGQASVSITAGRQVGTTVVRAIVGDVRKEVTLKVGPGPAARLIVMRDTSRVAQGLSLNSTRPVLLRVLARDSFDNAVPVTGLRAAVRNPEVLRVARADTVGGAGRLELKAQTSGTTQVDLEAAGVRQTLPAEVLLPVGGGSGGVIAFRAGYTAFSYHFLKLALRGTGGPFAEVNFGWTLVPGIRLTTGVSVARVALDTGGVHAPTTLMDGSLRLEVSPLRRGSVRPVVAVGGGQYQTRAPDLNGLGRHTSQFWLAGAGMDFPLRNKAVVEFRAITHQLHQSKTQFADAGSVGSLMAVTVGFRLGS